MENHQTGYLKLQLIVKVQQLQLK